MTDNQLSALLLEASLLKGEIDDLKSLLDGKEKKLTAVREQILKTLELLEIDKTTAHGFTFYKKNKSSVTTPKTAEEKKALFEFLQERGIFFEFASVNSQSLNALYRSLADEAAEKGVLDYEMPGVGKATEYTTLEIRRS